MFHLGADNMGGFADIPEPLLRLVAGFLDEPWRWNLPPVCKGWSVFSPRDTAEELRHPPCVGRKAVRVALLVPSKLSELEEYARVTGQIEAFRRVVASEKNISKVPMFNELPVVIAEAFSLRNMSTCLPTPFPSIKDANFKLSPEDFQEVALGWGMKYNYAAMRRVPRTNRRPPYRLIDTALDLLYRSGKTHSPLAAARHCANAVYTARRLRVIAEACSLCGELAGAVARALFSFGASPTLDLGEERRSALERATLSPPLGG